MAPQDRFSAAAEPVPGLGGGHPAPRRPLTAAGGADGLLAAFRQLAGGEGLQSAGAAVLTQGCATLGADEGVLLLAADAGLPAPVASPPATSPDEVTWLDVRAASGEGLRPVAHIGTPGPQGRLGTRPTDQVRAAGAVSARRAVTHDGATCGGEVWCPLLVKGRAVGAVAFRRQAGPFAPAELVMAEVLAAGAALATDRLRVYELWAAKLSQADAAHAQLLRYADDLRSTFATERRRAVELHRALDGLDAAYQATVRALASATEEKDGCTGGHLARVSAYGTVVTRVFDPALATTPGLEYAFLLHDVGKIGIPDAVLTKPGPLTPAETALMREHPAIGLRILAGVPGMDVVREVVYSHHERWDGGGYPRGLAGDEIPRAAQVFAAVDALDAMTTDRPYSAAIPMEEALERLSKESGSQLAPDAVRALCSVDLAELEHIRISTPPPSGQPWLAPHARTTR